MNNEWCRLETAGIAALRLLYSGPVRGGRARPRDYGRHLMNDVHLLLGCPDHFAVSYEINPWMHAGTCVDLARARDQWQNLLDTYHELGARTDVLPPVSEQPDFVYVANAGLVQGRTIYLSRFRHPERQGEEPHYARWFRQRGYCLVCPPAGVAFEGAAEVRRAADGFFGGWGIRTDRRVHDWLAERLGLPAIPLRLIDPRFYHLDTGLNVLPGGIILYYPEAFDPAARQSIRRHAADVIELTEAEAVAFAANCTVVGRTVVLGWINRRLQEEFERRGLAARTVQVDEFRKGGGSIACLTLPLSGGWTGAGGNAWNELSSSSSRTASSGH